MPFRKPDDEGGRPTDVTETLVATGTAGAVAVAWDADQAVTALYSANYRSLVRLSVLLVRDIATAEEVVQDAFVAMHKAWRRLRDPDKALAYLRKAQESADKLPPSTAAEVASLLKKVGR